MLRVGQVGGGLVVGWWWVNRRQKKAPLSQGLVGWWVGL